MVVTSFAKGKPLSKERDAKPTGLMFFKEAMPAGLPEEMGLAVFGS